MRFVGLLLCVLAVTTSCFDREQPFEEQAPAPDWVEQVRPEPGAVGTATDGVRVDHSIVSGDRDIRLLVDGVDVTTYTTLGRGRIRYESGVGPVVLEPGAHQAEVQLVTLPAFGEQFEVIDTYSWEFTTR